jgi:hypothetical protein
MVTAGTVAKHQAGAGEGSAGQGDRAPPAQELAAAEATFWLWLIFTKAHSWYSTHQDTVRSPMVQREAAAVLLVTEPELAPWDHDGSVGYEMKGRALLLVAVVMLMNHLGLAGQSLGRQAEIGCSVVDIDQIGPAPLTTIKTMPGVSWWLELDAELVVCGSEQTAAMIGRRHRLLRVYSQLDSSTLYLAGGFRLDELAQLGAELIARGGRTALVSLEPAEAVAWYQAEAGKGDGWRRELRPLTPELHSKVIVRQLANHRSVPAAVTKVSVTSMVDELDGDRWFADLSTLAGYSRWTYGTEIDLARDWLVQQLEALPGLTVTTPSFDAGGVTAYNVVATLPGRTRSDDWYIVGGHYDSISEAPGTAAPGAEDNASGCAGVLEVARVISSHPPEGTVLFICYSGEEQNLYGSKDHAAHLVLDGDDGKVQAMVNMDMIGYTGDAELDCLLESRALGQSLIDALAAAATQHTTLTISTSTFAWGSDHVPYLNRDMPAVLVIENDYSEYPYYHSTGDTPDKITIDMGYQVLRMALATVAELAGAGTNQVFTDGFESGDLGRWSTQVGATSASPVRRGIRATD